MELVAVEEPPPPKEPEPLPPPEEVDVVLEEIIEEPEPEPEPIEADAQVSREASAETEEVVVDFDKVSAWVFEQIEKEKYYPKAAQKAGYEGVFDLLVIVNAEGMISEASITHGKGHPLLRRALEKMLDKLPGRSFSEPPGRVIEMAFEFEFEF